MKIADVSCVPVQAPGRTLVVVLVETDEGLVGVGEAGLQRRPWAIDGAIRHLRSWLVGEDPMRIEYLWQRMFRGGFYPADRVVGSAIAGIDIALWDIKGKALGVPVYELLGGRCRDGVDCYLHAQRVPGLPPAAISQLDSADPEATAEVARHCRDLGHAFFRLGLAADGDLFEPRRAVRRLLAQLRAVRAAVGDDLELLVDLHGRLDLAEAVWFCRQAEAFSPFLVEDALRSEHPQGYRQLRRRVGVPLAAGEQWSSKWEFRQVIEEELVDYARVDICIAGGLGEARKIASMAETHGITVMPHNPLGPICTAACLQFDLACQNAGPQEVAFPPAAMLPDVFSCAFELRGDRLTVPTEPGIGVRFDRVAAADYPATPTEPPHFRRRDGAFTNY